MKHVIRQGECLPSVAARYGFAWKTVWDHPANAALRQRRPSPAALVPGDEVEIPERQPRTATAATGQTASFTAAGVMLRLRLVERGAPLAQAACTLTVDGRPVEATTDGEGMLEVALPRTATRARLAIDGRPDALTLLLGHLDPASEVSGQQGRLQNLGLWSGALDGAPSEALRWAIRAFQSGHGLPETGEADRATQERLVEAHGC